MEATILNKIGTNSIPMYNIIDYKYEGSVPGSQGLVEMLAVPLPSKTISEESHYKIPAPYTMEGEAYGIILKSFAISCSSSNYTAKLFNKFDQDAEAFANSIYEVLHYSALNKSKFDTNLGSLIIVNKDEPMTSNLYLHVINYDSVETGEITFSLTYEVIQNKPIIL